ncbi:hypothetical protein [Pseudofrankia inefficax]|uniref:Uncharacterized protein n=1 Tax=Pseudofrankia inefficax (strain DSM 45817 / CECT 9037 / DDB 130130 / EuI1c) TaxID=298654 RepID=E3IY43_PSEI1|nr:hypothetical protein [Pseudofrankia inefficax]ADP82641.1 hypothetical protein FraEuI1c_4648 [Pseudofrankia inefficax]
MSPHSMDVHSKDVHSKDVHPKDVHPKDVAELLARPDMAAPLPGVILAWGPLAIPVLVQIPPAAVVGLAVRSVEALTDAGVITVDQREDLQSRIRALENLAQVGVGTGSFTVPPAGEPIPSVYELVSATLPDPSLSGFWNVVETAVVALAGVLGDAVLPGAGGPRAALLAAVAWHEWVDPERGPN